MNVYWTISLLASTILLVASADAEPALSTTPVKWLDADNKSIPEPAEIRENQVWDIADHTLFFQVARCWIWVGRPGASATS